MIRHFCRHNPAQRPTRDQFDRSRSQFEELVTPNRPHSIISSSLETTNVQRVLYCPGDCTLLSSCLHVMFVPFDAHSLFQVP
jgi:hypothetical protein